MNALKILILVAAIGLVVLVFTCGVPGVIDRGPDASPTLTPVSTMAAVQPTTPSQPTTVRVAVAPTRTPTATPTRVPVRSVLNSSVNNRQIASKVENLIVGGDFETPLVGSRWQTFTGKSLPGWTVVESVEITGSYWDACDGTQSLDLDGRSPGTIFQDINTVPGQIYELGFCVSGNFAGGDPIKRVHIQWDSSTVDILEVDTGGISARNMAWQKKTYRVSATTAVTRVTFQSATPSGRWGVVLDNISVSIPSGVPVVPKPTPTPVPPAPTPVVVVGTTPSASTNGTRVVPSGTENLILFRSERVILGKITLPAKISPEDKAVIKYKFEKGGKEAKRSSGLIIAVRRNSGEDVKEGVSFDYVGHEQVQGLFSATGAAADACYDRVVAQVFIDGVWEQDVVLVQGGADGSGGFCVQNPVHLSDPRYDISLGRINVDATNQSRENQVVTPQLTCPSGFSYNVNFWIGSENAEIAKGASFELEQRWTTLIQARIRPASPSDLNRIRECVLTVK